MAYPTTYTNLASVYRTLGQYEKSNDVLQEYIRANPNVAQGYQGLGALMGAWGKYEEALQPSDKQLELAPGDLSGIANKRAIFIVTERWTEAQAIDSTLLAASDPFWRFSALMDQATLALYKGRATEAANARLEIAGILEDRGEYAAALASAERAVADTNGIGPLTASGRSIAARLRYLLHRDADAAKTEAEMDQRIDRVPSDDLKRVFRLQHTGFLAGARKDAATAIRDLSQAEPLLRPGDSNVDLAFPLGEAFLQSGDDIHAAQRLERVVAGVRRTFDPIAFVRSLYYLGQINERNGDRAKATECYKRFVQYWGDGDIDRDRVADAKKKIS